MTRHRRRWRRSNSRPDEGAAAVEFALVMPLLIYLAFGIIAFGVVFAQQLSLGNAARQGARHGVVAHHTCKDIVDEVRQSATTIAMEEKYISVEVQIKSGDSPDAKCAAAPEEEGDSTVAPCRDSSLDDELIVIARYTSELIIPLVIVEPTFTLEARGVFRCEFS
jgi:hypothetical protein